MHTIRSVVVQAKVVVVCVWTLVPLKKYLSKAYTSHSLVRFLSFALGKRKHQLENMTLLLSVFFEFRENNQWKKILNSS